MIEHIWHLLPYIIFGASMGSSAVHFFRRQFPRQEEPPQLPKENPIQEIGGDPAIQIFSSLGIATKSIIDRQRRTILAPSLILITMGAAVSISKWIGDRK